MQKTLRGRWGVFFFHGALLAGEAGVFSAWWECFFAPANREFFRVRREPPRSGFRRGVTLNALHRHGHVVTARHWRTVAWQLNLGFRPRTWTQRCPRAADTNSPLRGLSVINSLTLSHLPRLTSQAPVTVRWVTGDKLSYHFIYKNNQQVKLFCQLFDDKRLPQGFTINYIIHMPNFRRQAPSSRF